MGGWITLFVEHPEGIDSSNIWIVLVGGQEID